MKESKRLAVKSALLKAGFAGVTRAEFEADRLRFGTAFLRRIQEVEERFLVEKEYQGGFIVKWTLVGTRNVDPKAALRERLVPIGAVLGWEFLEVCP